MQHRNNACLPFSNFLLVFLLVLLCYQKVETGEYFEDSKQGWRKFMIPGSGHPSVARHIVLVKPQSTYICRVQSSVWRLAKY
jgi:hypothetical protein